MRIGASLILIALGAILVWGVDYRTSGFNIDIIGYILMAVGAVGLVLTLVMASGRDTDREVIVRRDDEVL